MASPGQNSVLYVLLLEDDPNDAELILRELVRSGYMPRARRVQNEPEYLGALEAGYAPGRIWDVILADNSLPGFSGLVALQRLHECGLDVPFIIVSGTIGEELAVQAVKNGASDYLLKDRLSRLGSAVTRALEERQLRQSQRRAEENYYRLFESSLAGIYQTSPDGQLLTANPALARMFGYDSPAELIASHSDLARQSYVDHSRRAEFTRQMTDRDVIAGFESEQYRKDGSTIWISDNARAVRDAQGSLLFYEGIIEDITARKRSEEALRASEQHYRLLFEGNPRPMWVYDTKTLGFLAVNDAAIEHYGYERAEFLAMTVKDIRPPDELQQLEINLAGPSHPRERSGPWRHRKKDGTLIAVEIVSHDIAFSGRPSRLVLANDITDKLAAEQALQTSEQRYKGLFADSPIALWEEDFSAVKQRLEALRQGGVTDVAAYLDQHPEFVAECASLYKILDVNRNTLTLFGAESKEELTNNLDRIFGFTVNGAIRDEIRGIADGKSEHHLEAINRTLRGEELQISLSWAALPGHEHDLARVIVSTLDITEQKRAEHALSASEQRYRALIENSSDGIALLDSDGIVLYTSPAAARIVGGTPDDWVGGNFLNRVHPEDAPRLASLLAELVQAAGAPRTAEFQYRRRDETWCWLEATATNMLAEPAVRAIVANYRDITERKRTDEALRRSETDYRALADNSVEGIEIYQDQKVIYANPAATRILGYAVEELTAMSVEQIVALTHPLDRSIAAKRAQKRLAGEALAPAVEIRILRKDGSTGWVQAFNSPIEYHGRPALLSTMIDITERKRADEALAQERNLLRTLIDNIPDAIYVKDCEGRFIIKNLADARKMGAATPEETIGRTDFDYYPNELAAQYQSDDRAVIDSGQVITNREEPITEADGRTGWVSTTKVPLRDSQGNVIGLVGIGHDITSRKQANEALRQSQNALETAQALAHLGSWTREAASNVTIWSKELFRLHYLTPAEIAPPFDNYIETVHPDDRANVVDQISAVAQSVDHATCLYRTNPTLGPIRILELHLHKIRDALGQTAGWHGTVQDVTDREQRLAELEAVNRVSSALRAAQHVEELLPPLLEEALAILNGSAGSVWLYEPSTDEVRLACEHGWDRAVPPLKRGVGIPGYVVATGQAYVSRELRNDSRMPESVRGFVPPGRGGACVPIRAGDEIIGALYLNIDLPREFSSADVSLLTTLAEIGGIAIHRTRLHEQIELRLGQLTALREVDRAIMGSLDLRLTLDILLEQVTAKLGVDAAAVLLFDDMSAMLNFAAGRGFRTRAIPQTHLQLGESYAGRAGLERRIVQASDLGESGTEFQSDPLLAAEEFVSYVGAPLITKGQLRGVLEVFHRSRLAPTSDWMSFLEALVSQAAIAVDNATLFANLERSNADLQLAYDATIEGWSRALDLRDKETEGHSRRVTELTERLAATMGVSPEALVHIRRGALLHDIGKMGVPDHILLKPGPLTDDEWITMRQHPQFAYDMISPISYLLPALDIPYSHHEMWDGTGYPRGLKGEEIPLAARVFAVVDVWDALRSDRPYRAAWPADRVREHIRSLAGTHLDPQVVNAALASDVLGQNNLD